MENRLSTSGRMHPRSSIAKAVGKAYERVRLHFAVLILLRMCADALKCADIFRLLRSGRKSLSIIERSTSVETYTPESFTTSRDSSPSNYRLREPTLPFTSDKTRLRRYANDSTCHDLKFARCIRYCKTHLYGPIINIYWK
jgi:hypothetical protein